MLNPRYLFILINIDLKNKILMLYTFEQKYHNYLLIQYKQYGKNMFTCVCLPII